VTVTTPYGHVRVQSMPDQVREPPCPGRVSDLPGPHLQRRPPGAQQPEVLRSRMNTSQSPPQPTNLMTLLLVGLPLVIDNGLWPSSSTLVGNTTLVVIECDYVHPPP
jgi:hypothetical protein